MCNYYIVTQLLYALYPVLSRCIFDPISKNIRVYKCFKQTAQNAYDLENNIKNKAEQVDRPFRFILNVITWIYFLLLTLQFFHPPEKPHVP